MSKEFSQDELANQQEYANTWEGRIGQKHFRLQWRQGPNSIGVHFQPPFTTTHDPDGMGSSFSPSIGFMWDRGKGIRSYGKYANQWNKIQQKTSLAIEKAIDEMELGLTALRKEWEKRQATLHPSESAQPGTLPQRVRIEIEETEDSIEYDIPLGDTNSDTFPMDVTQERESQRRTILEAFHAGSLSLEETEQQLDKLGRALH